MENMQSTIPTTTSNKPFIEERPPATNHKLRVDVMNMNQLGPARWRVCRPAVQEHGHYINRRGKRFQPTLYMSYHSLQLPRCLHGVDSIVLCEWHIHGLIAVLRRFLQLEPFHPSVT